MGNGSSNGRPDRAPRGLSVSGWPGGGAAVEGSGSNAGTNSVSDSNLAASIAALKKGDRASRAAGNGTSAAAAPRWLGKRVGRFKLLALLGQGAMGRVFRAEDTLMGRHIALKILPRTVKKGPVNVGAEMLIREARAAAAIEHPNAVAVYEVNQAGDVCYVAMELLEGGSLRDLVRAAGPMDLTRACLLCAEAAEALAAAHAAGVVHRDVKPANLMLSRQGRCKVVDFGLARLDEAGRAGPWAADAASPESVGTPQFIAPEILAGTPAGPASDIYSLGGTLFYLLTGRPPYEAKPPRDVLRMHVEAPVPDIRRLRPDVGSGLADAVAKALAKRPADRWASMEQFARVLRMHAIPTGTAEPAAAIATASSTAPSSAVPGRTPRPASPLMPPLPQAEPVPPVAPRTAGASLRLPTWPWLAGGGVIAASVIAVVCIVAGKAPSADVATRTGEATSLAPTQRTPIPAPAAAPVYFPPPPSPQTVSAPEPSHAAPPASRPAVILPHDPGAALALGDFARESDLGDVKVPGLVNFDAPRHNYTVTGDGFDIYQKSDSGHFVWRTMSGDLTIKAAIRFLGSSPARFRKAALIVRQSMDPASPFADIVLHGEGTVAVQHRLTAHEPAEQLSTDLTGATLWLVRRGDHFTGYVSSPGGDPQRVAEVVVPMKDPVCVALAVSARDGRDRPGTKPETAIFSGVEIDPVARLTTRPTPP